MPAGKKLKQSFAVFVWTASIPILRCLSEKRTMGPVVGALLEKLGAGACGTVAFRAQPEAKTRTKATICNLLRFTDLVLIAGANGHSMRIVFVNPDWSAPQHVLYCPR